MIFLRKNMAPNLLIMSYPNFKIWVDKNDYANYGTTKKQIGGTKKTNLFYNKYLKYKLKYISYKYKNSS
jgi:hypothetical protein